MPEKIILYAHPFCAMVGAVEGMLRRVNADYEYINIYADVDALLHVRQINNGYDSVPTLVFPDGTTLTEPSTAKLAHKLEQLGYDIPEPVWMGWLRRVFKRSG